MGRRGGGGEEESFLLTKRGYFFHIYHTGYLFERDSHVLIVCLQSNFEWVFRMGIFFVTAKREGQHTFFSGGSPETLV